MRRFFAFIALFAVLDEWARGNTRRENMVRAGSSVCLSEIPLYAFRSVHHFHEHVVGLLRNHNYLFHPLAQLFHYFHDQLMEMNKQDLLRLLWLL